MNSKFSTANSKKADAPQSFLRAARSGNLQKILDFLNQGIDINTCNPNGLTALHLASKEGHLNVVNELLNREVNVNAATKKGNTALHIASLAGQFEVAKLLIEHGAQVNCQSQNGFTPLYMAAQDNHIEVVKLLLASGANQSLATDDGFTPLAVALQQNHDRTVALLLENDSRGKMRLPALHIAAKKDDLKAATLLLDNNDSNVDHQSSSGFTPLHIAAHYGNVNIANLLIEKGANVNFQARNNITPLHVGSKWGNLSICQRLVDSHAELECKTRDGLTPLHCASRSGHDAIVDYFLNTGANYSAKTKNGLTPLHIAAQGDHLDTARLLIHRGADVDDKTVDYLTPIHVSAHCGSVKVCKLLLDRHCDADARALNGFTPLHIASKKNRIKIVELLLKYGAIIEANTESGLTPLHVASFMGHDKIVVLLLQHGANPNAPTMRAETALHLAVRSSQLDVARLLLRNNAQVDAKARENQTPLHIASRTGQVELVSMLLEHGANPDNETKDNYTALHIAAKEAKIEVAELLLNKANANIESVTKNGFTSLHVAAKYGQLDIARLLLEHGAQVDAQGRNNLTPLHVATHYGNDELAHMLLRYNASAHNTAKNGYTPLHIAASKLRLPIAKTLLDQSVADPNAQSRNGFTPLHLASQEGSEELVRLLLIKGADVDACAKNGLCPLHLAAQDDHVPVATILDQDYKCALSLKTKAGYTPLHTACHFGRVNMVRYLLGRGSAVNQQTQLGSTSLHLAAQQGHLQLIYILLDAGADPNIKNESGLTPAHVAKRQHYLNIFEVLRNATTIVETWEEIEEEVVTRIELERPDMMGEHPLSDWDDDGGELDFTAMPASPLFARQPQGGVAHDDSMAPGGSDTLIRLKRPYGTSSSQKRGSLSGGDDDGDQDVDRDFEKTDISALKASRAYTGAPNVSMEWDVPADNVPITRKPITTGFLVSFLVDARGGSMRSSRYPGLRILVPSNSACAPTRITCRMQRHDRIPHPPQLNDGDGLACRILEMGPSGYKFNSPVLLEIPHYASLGSREREIIILRSDNGETWKEHTFEATEQAVHDAVGSSFGDSLKGAEELAAERIVRILTTDFPQYFALVTRLRQESTMIGAQGGVISSTVVPQVQAVFPENALQKRIRVGLQAQPIHSHVVLKLYGTKIGVSSIVTVEPRRRKFHKPITLTIPLPRLPSADPNQNSQVSANNLRLLCSITGGTAPAHWEDITGSTPLSRVKDCVSFTTTVSARFWLIDCQNTAKSSEIAEDLYRESIFVPYMGKFVIFSKRIDVDEAAIRCFCITDDKIDKTLECQEGFELRAASPVVEVLNDRNCWLEFDSAGTIVPVAKQNEMLYVNFQAFRENRLGFNVRVKDSSQSNVGKIALMRESRQILTGNDHIANTILMKPLCTLEVHIQSNISSGPTSVRQYNVDSPVQTFYLSTIDSRVSKPDGQTIARSDLDLADLAGYIESDWPALAQELQIDQAQMEKIRLNTCDKDRAYAVLTTWISSSSGSGNELERALRRIGREDVVKQCMHNIVPVTGKSELEQAKMKLSNQSDMHYPFTIGNTFGTTTIESHTKFGTMRAADGETEFEELVTEDDGPSTKRSVVSTFTESKSLDDETPIHAVVDERNLVITHNETEIVDKNKEQAFSNLIDKLSDMSVDVSGNFDQYLVESSASMSGDLVDEDLIDQLRRPTPPPPVTISEDQLQAFDKFLQQ